MEESSSYNEGQRRTGFCSWAACFRTAFRRWGSQGTTSGGTYIKTGDSSEGVSSTIESTTTSNSTRLTICDKWRRVLESHREDLFNHLDGIKPVVEFLVEQAAFTMSQRKDIYNTKGYPAKFKVFFEVLMNSEEERIFNAFLRYLEKEHGDLYEQFVCDLGSNDNASKRDCVGGHSNRGFTDDTRPRHLVVLKRHRHKLVEELNETEIDYALDLLYSTSCISHVEKEAVEAQTTRTAKAHCIIDVLECKDGRAFRMFCESFREQGKCYMFKELGLPCERLSSNCTCHKNGINLKEISLMINNTSTQTSNLNRNQTKNVDHLSSAQKNYISRHVLRENFCHLVNTLKPTTIEDITSILYAQGHLLDEHKETIEAQISSKLKARVLLDVLIYMGFEEYGAFLESLKQVSLKWLVKQLENSQLRLQGEGQAKIQNLIETEESEIRVHVEVWTPTGKEQKKITVSCSQDEIMHKLKALDAVCHGTVKSVDTGSIIMRLTFKHVTDLLLFYRDYRLGGVQNVLKRCILGLNWDSSGSSETELSVYISKYQFLTAFKVLLDSEWKMSPEEMMQLFDRAEKEVQTDPCTCPLKAENSSSAAESTGSGAVGARDDMVASAGGASPPIGSTRTSTLSEVSAATYSSEEPSDVTRVSCSEYPEHLQRLLGDEKRNPNRSKLAKQYQLLEAMKIPLTPECTIALKPENLHKNRNQNIYPCEKFRVKVPQTDKATEYINAVHVNGFTQENSFILTQTPMPHTVNDFWNMIFRLGIDNIVMLDAVRLHDETCVSYWPANTHVQHEYGSIRVRTINEIPFATRGVVQRDMEMLDKLTGRIATVQQLQIVNWSYTDDLTEELGNNLVFIIQQIKKSGKPLVIHCMDGAGQSGLFCALMYLVQMLKIRHEIDIYSTVKSIRQSRPHLISSYEQYNFLHKLVPKYLAKFDKHPIGQGV